MKKFPAGLRRVIDEVAEAAGYCHERLWAEKSAGNISVNVTELFPGKQMTPASSFVPLHRQYRALAGQILLLTRTGSRMRDVASKPYAELGCLLVSPAGDTYTMVGEPGSGPDFRPTTELPTHLAIHEFLVKSKSPYRAVLHTHPDECIALTHIVGCRDAKKLNRILLSMIPETVIVNPEGIACLPFTMPGSETMAAGTARLLRQSPVVFWEKHGVIAVASDIIGAFDRIDTMNKAAGLFLLCCMAGVEPRGLTPRQVRDIRQRFHPARRSGIR